MSGADPVGVLGLAISGAAFSYLAFLGIADAWQRRRADRRRLKVERDEARLERDKAREDHIEGLGHLRKAAAEVERLRAQVPKPTLYCSFCGESQHKVAQLIAGPKVLICNECVGVCATIVAEARVREMPADYADPAPDLAAWEVSA